MNTDPWLDAHETVNLRPAHASVAVPALPARADQRRRRRSNFRGPALIEMDSHPGRRLGVLCRDISQVGVSLLAPRHALPLEQGRLTLPGGRTLPLRVRRCQRVGERCFLLGCDFETKPDGGPLAVYGPALSAATDQSASNAAQ